MSALEPLGSIKLKLGVLVVVSVVVAGLVATLGAAGGVPLWLTLPVTVALALAVTQLLAAGMTAPLREMTAAAQRMATGDYEARVLTANVDEVGRLADAFNQMSADLARVDAERRDLIATVSHELRTPVAAVTAQLENLADGVVEPTTERLAAALASSRRMGDLLADLLDLSRLEAGVAPLEVEATALADLVRSSAEQVRAAGRTAPVEVDVADDFEVCADSARLQQLLTNALDNAARHTPDGAAVRVSAGGRDDGGWWLEVVDAGPGGGARGPRTGLRAFRYGLVRWGDGARPGRVSLGGAPARRHAEVRRSWGGPARCPTATRGGRGRVRTHRATGTSGAAGTAGDAAGPDDN